jgi:hypothetical protein
MSPLELPPDPELELLAADLRALRPEPDPAFLATLDARVAAGFPARAAGGAGPRRLRWRRPQVLVPGVAGALAAAAVTLAVVLPGSGGDAGLRAPATSVGSGSSTAARDNSTGAAAPKEAAGQSPTVMSAPAPGSAPGSAPGAGAAPDAASGTGGPRQVERSAELTLTAPADEVQQTADGVVRATQAVGGYVQTSQVSVRDGGGGATFTLRIPSARLDDALARLSKLAHVGALTQNGEDITATTASAAQRLADARAERAALLRALGRATTDRQVVALRARLSDNRAVIARRTGELAAVRRRADLATVAVTVEGTRAAHRRGGGAWTPGDALHDAARVLEVAGGVALVGLAVLAPLAVLAALALGAARLARRRRREAALDQAI